MYVDLFAIRGKSMLDFFYATMNFKCMIRDSSTLVKSDEKALDKRKQGNKLFAKREWTNALELYNESLCYAKPGSTLISLAYANRSACFIRMKMYRECLVDIELAKSFGFPLDKMPKLDERMAECLRHIADGEQIDSQPQMSYDPDEKFPCMANVLKIERNSDGSHSVIAKEDIDVGQTIAVEKAFTACLYMCYGWRCNICLKRNANMIPCTKCTTAMFCYGTCDKDVIHENECGLTFIGSSQADGMMMNLARMIFKLLEIFSSADELMDFVEEVINGDKYAFPDELIDYKSRYAAFLKLPYSQSLYERNEFMGLTYCIYKKLLDIPQVSDAFKTVKHRRFLMHLMALHALITDSNSLRVRYGRITFNGDDNIMCSHTGLITRYFGHSCAPNVFWGDCDGNNVFITIRPVKKGEALHTFFFDILLASKSERQQKLLEKREFVCKCMRCTGQTATREQRNYLLMSPDFRYIAAANSTYAHQDIAMEKCKAFLRMCGQMPWCDEIGFVAFEYVNLLRQRLMGTVNFLTVTEKVAKDFNL